MPNLKRKSSLKLPICFIPQLALQTILPVSKKKKKKKKQHEKKKRNYNLSDFIKHALLARC